MSKEEAGKRKRQVGSIGGANKWLHAQTHT